MRSLYHGLCSSHAPCRKKQHSIVMLNFMWLDGMCSAVAALRRTWPPDSSSTMPLGSSTAVPWLLGTGMVSTVQFQGDGPDAATGCGHCASSRSRKDTFSAGTPVVHSPACAAAARSELQRHQAWFCSFR